ncbi:hypothetical protein ACQW5G_01070 [Fructilactobacillus sp. Tb1]|uniref:hypothetical protein n=1 Tax=Fructilactobacillus sp. Tb1 TaxID=3422304 RepID=UPI003D2A7056
MAQGGLARKEISSHTYTVRQAPKQITREPESVTLALSQFEKCLIGLGVIITFCLLVSIVSTKNAMNVSQRSLQNLTTKSSRLNNENQSMSQALDGMENDAINRVVKKDNLSIADASVRDVTR